MNGNGLVRSLERTATRWPLAAAARVDTFVKQRVSEAAGVQSRRVLAAAQAELANRALRRFIELLYETGADGRLYNVADDGRALIAAPWSRTQHAAYGLTDHQGRVLRRVLASKLASLGWRWRLFVLDRRGPRVKLGIFSDAAAALDWLDRFPVTADEWLQASDTMPRRGHEGRRE